MSIFQRFFLKKSDESEFSALVENLIHVFFCSFGFGALTGHTAFTKLP